MASSSSNVSAFSPASAVLPTVLSAGKTKKARAVKPKKPVKKMASSLAKPLKNLFLDIRNPNKKRVSRKIYRAEKQANAVLVLEDGQVFYGIGTGYQGVAVGELCFNTSMSGYQEIMSDPSYAGQIINFTTPHIGNVGCNQNDMETFTPFARGLVVADMPTQDANYRSQGRFTDWLTQHKLIAISGLDTRALTHYIRENGAPKAVIAYYGERPASFEITKLHKMAQQWQGLQDMDLSLSVTGVKTLNWQEALCQLDDEASALSDSAPTTAQETSANSPHIVVIDYGAKHNILRHLKRANIRVTLVPAQHSAADIIALKPNGVMLSNGPGDPAATAKFSNAILQEIMRSNVPIFGICLGYQLLSLALGAKTAKMQAGHRGGNHPVKNLLSGNVEITSQNHGFKVLPESLPSNVEVTHISLFDQSLEGFRLKDKNIFAVQYHPEASPGPHDSHYLFKQFFDMVAQHHAG